MLKKDTLTLCRQVKKYATQVSTTKESMTLITNGPRHWLHLSMLVNKLP